MRVGGHVEQPARLPAVIAARRVEAISLTVGTVEEISRRGLHLLVGLAPVGPTGNFQRRLGAETTANGELIRGKLGGRAPHTHLVDKGRGPGKQPPVWLIAKLFELPRVQAFAVARAIGRRGTKGHRIFERAVDQLRPDVRRLAARLLERIGSLR